MVIGSNILAGASGQGGVHRIEQSIRFNDDDSAFLKDAAYSASPTSATDCTLSFWVKRCNLGSTQCLFFGGDGSGSTWEIIRFESDDQFRVGQASSAYDIITTQVFRDVSAWSNFVIAFNGDDSTAADRIKIYHNGSRISDFSLQTNPSSGYVTNFNSGGGSEERLIGLQGPSSGGSNAADCYLAEINFIDGQALDPTSFGETNSDTGQWVPINTSGLTFGTNGYRITGADSSDLGADQAGSNDFTSSGLAAADQVTDSPTDNHCVLNALDGAGTLSDGNLVNAATGSGFVSRRATIGIPSSGKWAFRVKKSANNFMVGVMAPQATDGDPDTNGVDAVFYYDENGTSSGDIQTRRSGSKVVEATNPPAGIAADTFMEVLIDKDNNRLGVVIGGTAYIAVDSGVAIQDTMTQIFVATAGSGVTATVDFGQSGFTPSQTNYKALSTANLDDPSIANPSDHMDIQLWAGNSTDGRAITGYNFAPSWVWIKARNNAYSHNITDAVRGAGNFSLANAADAEVDGPDVFGSTLAFTSDGFTLDNGTTSNLYVNETGTNYVGWAWKANGAGSSNTDGDITSTVSANTTSGFSVLTYSGNGSDNQTIGHGLGIAPKMIITKRRDAAGSNWTVYHDAVGINQVFYLNSTSAAASNTEQYRAVPTSSVYTVGVGGDINNSSGTYVSYVFAEVPGYSAIGSYTGTGSATAGPFVYTGMSPRFILFRVSSTSDAWQIYDTERYTFNPFGKTIAPNSNAAESSLSARLDILSNGFKVRTTNTALNGSGQTYVYMAFGDAFKTATAR